MEVLMPSEVARLVYGYLKDEGCDSAAQVFLETSPRLEECRAVVARGKNFNTRISDLRLTDILEKYCMATTIVQEKINQIIDDDLIKRTTDLVEQLRYLLEGSRSQRFVVNINVPSQPNSQTGDSPIISGSIRKRRHSNTERDRHKRAKFNLDKSIDQICNQNIDKTEATPLESLPGHSSWPKIDQKLQNAFKEFDNNENTTSDTARCNKAPNQGTEKATPEKTKIKKCTMGTSTDELTTFANSEVQTMPYDGIEPSESEWNDEPIENLSLITKELLVRTEMQERIADNINRAITKVINESSAKEEKCETQGSDANTSLMTELDNAIKTSVVTVTENDPVFEQFINEMIGQIEEPDTSPDEDCDATKKKTVQEGKSAEPTKEPVDEVETALHDQNAAAVMSIINANITSQMSVEVVPNTAPLETLAQKVNVSIPDLDDCNLNEPIELKPCGQVKEDTQVQKRTETVKPNSELKPGRKTSRKQRTPKLKETIGAVQSVPTVSSIPTVPTVPIVPTVETIQTVETVPTLVYTTKEEIENAYYYNNYHSNQPPNNVQKCKSSYRSIRPKGCEQELPPSQLPLQAPLQLPLPLPLPPLQQQPALYLKTVNVPVSSLMKKEQIVVPPKPAEESKPVTVVEPSQLKTTIVSMPTRKKRALRSHVKKKIVHPTTIPEEPENRSKSPTEPTDVIDLTEPKDPVSSPPVGESLTLYGAENSTAGVSMDAENMPILNLDTFCMTSTGFTPLLKFVDKKLDCSESEKPREFEKLMEHSTDKTELEETNFDLLPKRTPSVRGQNKNKRLSLSTPRRRSHIRALDFDTPKKSFSVTKNAAPGVIRQRSKSLCRATLFTSPPPSSDQQKTLKMCKTEATMSPLPEVSSCWEKYTGMGMILGSQSPLEPGNGRVPKTGDAASKKVGEKTEKSNVTEKSKVVSEQKDEKETKDETSLENEKDLKTEKVVKNEKPVKTDKSVKNEQPKTKKSWDEDLRASLAMDAEKQLECLRRKCPKEKLDKLAKKDDKNLSTSSFDKTDENNLTGKSDLSVDSANSSATEKRPVKKYAKLKTITTTVTKVVSGTIDVSPILDTKVVAAIKTPRKLEDNMLLDIPPTPRLHTPGNSTLSNYLKMSDESVKMQNFVSTPEIPPTPCIVFTPTPADKTMDSSKTHFGNAHYYHPDETRSMSKLIKRMDSNVKETPSCTSQIIEFEVIKENLPKEEAEKELKIATVTKDEQKFVSTTVVEEIHIESRLDSTDSDSDSSGSDSSSSCSNSSCTSCSSYTTVSPKSAKKKTRKTPNKSLDYYNETNSMNQNKDLSKISTEATCAPSTDEVEHEKGALEQQDSPAKVFSVFNKTEAEEEDAIKDTPAKEENEEAIISETPSSSKAGIENTTNLASKITAMMDSTKPKIVSIKKVSMPLDPRLIPSIARSKLCTVSPGKKKLQLQLEQKKERMKCALKNVIKGKVEKPKMHNLMSLKYGKRKIQEVSIKKNEVAENVVEVKKEVKKKENDVLQKDDKKWAHKMKVEQVRRDLFTHEQESADKRTTRSSSRRIMEAQTPAEEIQVPGVLEVLQLVPANKGEHESTQSNTSQNGVQAFIKIVYDESNCVKKRKRRCSNSELEIRLTDEDGQDYNLKPTEYQTLFDLPPKPKRRAPIKRAGPIPTTTLKRQRRPPAKYRNDDIVMRDIPKPLATSSPALKDEDANKDEHVEEKTKRNKKPKEEVQNLEMLNTVDLENFLDQVHGT